MTTFQLENVGLPQEMVYQLRASDQFEGLIPLAQSCMEIAGRVVAGPKGSEANVTLPIRIAVAKQFGGTGPLYSELFKIPVSLTAPTFGANYNQVFDQVTLTAGPQDRNLIIYVGFDEGPKT